MTKRNINTKLVHGGERRPLPDAQPVSTPIYASATFTYDSMQEIDQVFSGEKPGFIYTRYGNPTIAALEEAVREVEEGAIACAYATGMAAVHAALIACDLKTGSTVLASQDLYGATTSLLNSVFLSFGVKTVTADFSDLSSVRGEGARDPAAGADCRNNLESAVESLRHRGLRRDCARERRAVDCRQHVCVTVSLPAFETWRGHGGAQRDEVSRRSRRCDGRAGGFAR